jgi:outer membrane lipoprotein-sorting protein
MLRNSTIILITTILVFIYGLNTSAQQLSAKEIVKRSYDKMEGQTNESEMTMTIVRPKWSRSVAFKSFAKGSDLGLVLITAPAKDKGQTFLKRKSEMWNWVPSIGRMVKLPPSMLSQGWMGSDYSNDDLLKESSIVDDYDHLMLENEKYKGYDCYKVKMTPKPTAAVEWGYLIKWISRLDYFQLKTEFFDEDGKLLKTQLSDDIKFMHDRKIPTRYEIIPANEMGNKTIVVLNKVIFNKPIVDGFFSQQNMKNLR